MKILLGKTFGIGNAVLSFPLLQCLLDHGHCVDVLVGDSPDDAGAREIFKIFFPKVIVFVNRVVDRQYDFAIMSIPFDGRWINGFHFFADCVLDGRRRPGDVSTLGFSMWEKHESEYQLENARELGIQVELKKTKVHRTQGPIFLGVGFKRDAGGFGLSKHFGNDRFISVLNHIQKIDPDLKFISIGNERDVEECLNPISKSCENLSIEKSMGLGQTVRRIMYECRGYFGNDTGLMHVAALLGKQTFGLFSDPGLVIKNPPLVDDGLAILFRDYSDSQIANFVVDFFSEKF